MSEVIAKRKKAWIGHVVRLDGLLKLVIQGRMEGKRPKGRPSIGMIDDIMMGSYEHNEEKGSRERRFEGLEDMPCSRELMMMKSNLAIHTNYPTRYLAL